MATLTVRNIPDEDIAALRVRAAERGRSMEAEVRELIHTAAPPAANVSRPSPEQLPPVRPDIEARVKAVQDELRARFGGELPKGRVDAFLAERRAAAERGE